MNSINSWINEDEVRKLAEDLTAISEPPKERESADADGFAIIEKQGEEPKNKEAKHSDITPSIRESKSISLAEASARATSAGLIGKNKSEPKEVEVLKSEELVKEPALQAQAIEVENAVFPKRGDHYLNAIPVNIDENIRVSLPSVHTDKQIGTFEEIDKQLTNTVKAKGICVIDRDGDVLYSSMTNPYLVALTVKSMMGTKLMQTQDGEFGNIRLKMRAGEYLEFVSVKSTRGVLVLAVCMDHILGNANAQYVAGDVLEIADSV